MSTQRERLIAALEPSAIEGRHIGKSHAGLILHPRQASAIADALLPLIRQAQAEAKVEAWGQAKELIRVSDEDDRLEHTMHGGNLGPEWEQRTAGMNQAIEVIDYLMKPHVAAYRVGEEETR